MLEETPELSTLSDEALDKAVCALPRELAPARDLWPALAERLGARRQQRWRGQAGLWATAAALGALWFATLPAPTSISTPTAEQTEKRAPSTTDLVPLDVQLRELYETTQAAQLAALPLQGLPDLDVWDKAIAQVHGALRFYPDDLSLLDQLDRLYRQRLQVLQHAALSPDNSSHHYY